MRDCNQFRYSELYELNELVFHGLVETVSMNSTLSKKTVEIKIIENFKGNKITKIIVHGFNLEVGDEFIFLGGRNNTDKSYGEIMIGSCTKKIILLSNSTGANNSRYIASKDYFRFITIILREKKKQSRSSDLLAILKSDPFYSGLNLTSLINVINIEKNSKLILVKVEINDKGKIINYKPVSKINKKILTQIENKLNKYEWKFIKPPKNFSTLISLVYDKNGTNKIDF